MNTDEAFFLSSSFSSCLALSVYEKYEMLHPLTVTLRGHQVQMDLIWPERFLDEYVVESIGSESSYRQNTTIFIFFSAGDKSRVK